MTVVSMSLSHCQFGNLMGMRHVMTLWPFPTACFLQCFNKGSLNVLCATTALGRLDLISHHHVQCFITCTHGKPRVRNPRGRFQLFMEMNKSWIMVLSLKDASLGEESIL